MTNKSFCPLPFNGIRIDAIGTIRPCSLYEQNLTKKDGTPFNVNYDSISSVRNSSQLQKIQNDMVSGQYNSGCKKCWEIEASGGVSKRLLESRKYNWVEQYIKEGKTIPITNWNISFGTVCNLKCRTCSPKGSSSWAQEWLEAKKIYGPENEYFSFENEKMDYVIQHGLWSLEYDLLLWQELHDYLPYIEAIEFYGGEALYQKAHKDLLTNIVHQGFAGSIRLQYSTNGTQFDPDLFKLWEEFNGVFVMLSIDDIDERFNYLRHPAIWSEVENNTYEWIKHTPSNMKLGICSSISMMNYWFINEVVEWSSKLGLEVHLNLVQKPSYFNIQNYPEHLKAEIAQRNSNSRFAEINTFMQSNQIYKIKEFWRKINFWDKLRGESFKKTFPELYEKLTNV